MNTFSSAFLFMLGGTLLIGALGLVAWFIQERHFGTRFVVTILFGVVLGETLLKYDVLRNFCGPTTGFSRWVMGVNTTLGFCAINLYHALLRGKKYYEKYNATKWYHACMTSMCSGQIYFDGAQSKIPPTDPFVMCVSVLVNIGLSAIVIHFGYHHLSHFNVPITTQSSFWDFGKLMVHLELNLFALACHMWIMNILPAVWSVLLRERATVIPPYGWAFFASSPRSFWKDWSRPMGALLSDCIFKPLRGFDNPLIGVGLVFAVNCVIHFPITANINGGQSANWDWSVAFAVMGFSVWFEMVVVSYARRKVCEFASNGKETLNVLLDSLLIVLLHMSFCAVIFVLRDRALPTNFDRMIR